MAKLLYMMNISVDGYVADRDGDFGWSVPTADSYAEYIAFMRSVGTYIYGRRLYEMMRVWESAYTQADQAPFTPGLGELEREFATLWRAHDKIVISSTLSAVTTPRTQLEATLDLERIRALKAASPHDIAVGGPLLAGALLAAGLVDEVHAFVHPIVVGGGTPFLPQGVRMPLELLAQRRVSNLVHWRYGRRER